MTTIDRAVKRRARRIAADEAHAWARNLRLNNPNAKLVLCMLSLYVDGDGYCWVAIPTLADDTELSTQTVRNRLAWLEGLGVIARLPQWLDEYGRRNGDQRGKRTSDLIRLLMDADQDVIEDRAERGDMTLPPAPPAPAEPAGAAAISPIHGIGLNPVADPVSPTPALCQPYDSAEGLNSEPEPESPLKVPSGDESARASLSQDEPDGFGECWKAWPGHEIMRRDLALAEFRQLAIEQRQLVKGAIPLFAAMQAKDRPHTKTNFHIWLRSRGFEAFRDRLTAAPAIAAADDALFVIEGSEQDRALRFVRGLARQPQPFVRVRGDGSRGYPHKTEVGADLLAMLAFEKDVPLRWPSYLRGSPEFAAWQARFVHWIGTPLPMVPGSSAIQVPGPWPPKKDGTVYAVEDSGDQSGAA
jgi:hypothetical protein